MKLSNFSRNSLITSFEVYSPLSKRFSNSSYWFSVILTVGVFVFAAILISITDATLFMGFGTSRLSNL